MSSDSHEPSGQQPPAPVAQHEQAPPLSPSLVETQHAPAVVGARVEGDAGTDNEDSDHDFLGLGAGDPDHATGYADGNASDRPVKLAEAVDLLRQVLDDIHQQGRRPTAANVSARMRSRGFAPERLDFLSFRAFLAFAQELGQVELTAGVPGKVDVEVLLPGSSARSGIAVQASGTDALVAPGVLSRERVSRFRRVRQDLWQAFLDWDARKVRFWDSSSASIVFRDATSVAEPSSLDYADGTPDPTSHLMQIRPVSLEQQVEWMRLFVQDLPAGDERSRLEDALSSSTPLRAFVQTLRHMERLQTQWRQTLTKRATERIAEWFSEHNISIDIFQPFPASASSATLGQKMAGPPARRGSAVAPGVGDQAELRVKILDVLDRLPLAELLRLPIPAEYFFVP